MAVTYVDDIPTAQHVRTIKIIAVQKITPSPTHDLAALEVSGDIANEHNINFFALPPDASTPPLDTILGALGYPTSLSQPVMKGSRAAFPTMTYERIVTTNALLVSFDPQQHFLTTYSFAKDTGDQPHPGGFSGCGLWSDVPPTGIWHANLRFAGVIVAYYERRKLFRAIRAEIVVTFLKDSL